ncbi:hypothetical protein [Meiothermus sp. CFH 77666]|uniref:hypothetical protein n=1 Tax=Meiothermus sp. CFH 77666 TaxID=2817942 RepID=UPI001AA08618|nr:hypothetical protein [Meiothermus sp. CFH 77666]MBO1438541.1 hypothetical protein [Meiothermus sp. CFH 77666]
MKLRELGVWEMEEVQGGGSVCLNLGLLSICIEDGKVRYEYNIGSVTVDQKAAEGMSSNLREVNTAINSVFGLDRPYWDPYGISEREGEKYSRGKAF